MSAVQGERVLDGLSTEVVALADGLYVTILDDVSIRSFLTLTIVVIFDFTTTTTTTTAITSTSPCGIVFRWRRTSEASVGNDAADIFYKFLLPIALVVHRVEIQPLIL